MLEQSCTTCLYLMKESLTLPADRHFKRLVFADHYRAEVLSQNDYYPRPIPNDMFGRAFGMEQPGKSFNGIPYPYAFNGKRMENVELFTTNIYDYGMWSYDAKIGRFYLSTTFGYMLMIEKPVFNVFY